MRFLRPMRHVALREGSNPACTERPTTRRSTVSQSARTSESTAVPYIDISAALAGHARRETAACLGKAAREIGFIQIVGHGIDPALFHRIHDEARALWQLPDDRLDQLLSPTGHPFRGVRYALDPTGARIWQRLQNNRIESPAAAVAEGYEGDVLDYFGGCQRSANSPQCGHSNFPTRLGVVVV